MESLTVTLDTAKRLEAAGFPQKSAMWWGERPTYEHMPDEWQLWTSPWEGRVCFAAPTAQEIADQIVAINGALQLNFDKAGGSKWWLNVGTLELPHTSAPTMAEALAALWLKLHEAKQ